MPVTQRYMTKTRRYQSLAAKHLLSYIFQYSICVAISLVSFASTFCCWLFFCLQTHPARSCTSLSSMSDMSSPIPVVDFSEWNEGSKEKRKAIARSLFEACRDVGFCYITNHGISPEYLSQAFGWSKKLFDLKQEEKMLAPHPDGFAVHRGYSWPGLEKVSNAMGDEDDVESLKKELRQVSDIKVKSFDFVEMSEG